eukprot:3498826-Rhodomonas_salina.6
MGEVLGKHLGPAQATARLVQWERGGWRYLGPGSVRRWLDLDLSNTWIRVEKPNLLSLGSAIAPDGRSLASASDDSVCLWDVPGPTQV